MLKPFANKKTTFVSIDIMGNKGQGARTIESSKLVPIDLRKNECGAYTNEITGEVVGICRLKNGEYQAKKLY